MRLEMVQRAFPQGPQVCLQLRDMLLDAGADPVIHAASMQAVALLLEHVLEILASCQQKAQGLHLWRQRLPEAWTPFLSIASQQTGIQRIGLAAHIDTVPIVDQHRRVEHTDPIVVLVQKERDGIGIAARGLQRHLALLWLHVLPAEPVVQFKKASSSVGTDVRLFTLLTPQDDI